MSKNKEVIRIFTDGACSGNPGVGGWGCIVFTSKKHKIYSGGEEYTTNNRMELRAVLEAATVAIQAKHHDDFVIVSDSAYVIGGVTEWRYKWKKNKWKTSNKEDVKNRDIWVQLDALLIECEERGKKVTFEKVKGHNGHPLNEMVDKVAVEEVKKFKQRNIM